MAREIIPECRATSVGISTFADLGEDLAPSETASGGIGLARTIARSTGHTWSSLTVLAHLGELDHASHRLLTPPFPAAMPRQR